MIPDETYYRQLLQSYLRDELSGPEAGKLFDYIQQDPRRADRLLGEEGRNAFEEKLRLAPALPEDTRIRIHTRLLKSIRPVHQIHFLRRYWWAAAAVLLGIVTGGYLLYSGWESAPPVNTIAQQFKNDIAPGGNKAMLTLSNGATIILDSAHNGLLASQGNSQVVKVDSGLLAYNPQRAPVVRGQTTVQYNTLTTPRGGQYQLVLPDGSKVWLNAGSSIHYPIAFTGTEREVEITGEAYFEVTKNSAMPFIVKLPPSSSGESRGAVQVLGTHFNVNAYDDESLLKVTLLEGSVRVIESKLPLTPHSSQLLTPGQQAQVNAEGQIGLVKDADVDEAVAWKNGLFQFDGIDIHEVMRQVSRWYDVEVEYSGTVSQKFYGNISRSANVSEVFKMLQMTRGVKFNIQGKKIIVMP